MVLVLNKSGTTQHDQREVYAGFLIQVKFRAEYDNVYIDNILRTFSRRLLSPV
jgi:hypothetical protein